MTTYVTPSATHPRELARARNDILVYRPLLGHALLLGVAGDTLLRSAGLGPALPSWIAILCLSAVALTWRAARELPREAALWLTTALFFASFLVWRASDTLTAMDFLACLGALGMAAISLADDRAAMFAPRLRETVIAAFALARSIALGLPGVAFSVARLASVNDRLPSRLRSGIKAGLITGAVLVIFGSLLRSADPLFASFVALPDFDVAELFSHAFVAGFFAWVSAGWLRGALRPANASRHSLDGFPISLGALDITAGLGALLLLFSLYVLSQLGWYFGGEQFLRERTGLTAATYARDGFFQLVWVVALGLPLLMATRAALRDEPGLTRRHTLLSLPIIVLLGAIMISAIARMRLYVTYYGMTTDRLYPLAFMAWLAVVLVWFALTVLRDVPRPFVAGSLVTGALMLAALNLSDPDAIVARANLERAAHKQVLRSAQDNKGGLDLVYLATLSGNAVPMAVKATLSNDYGASPAERCAAARHLVGRWGPLSPPARKRREVGAWRSWNADEETAMRAVGAHSAELRALQHEVCPKR